MTDLIKVEGYTSDQINTIKKFIDPKNSFTTDQLHLFFHVCKEKKLDPLTKQIYAIPRGGQLTIQVSIDGLRLIAERTGKYAPGKATEYVHDPKGILISATAFVKKQSQDGSWHEVSATSFLKEYIQQGSFWTKMPHVMLEKVAESRALRRAFPGDLSGLYGEEEISIPDKDITVTREIKEDVQEIPMPFERIFDIREACSSEDVFESVNSRLKSAFGYEIKDSPESKFEDIMKAVNHYNKKTEASNAPRQ